MKPQPLSAFHQQLQQSWAIARPISRQWQSPKRKRLIPPERVVPVAIAWSLVKR